MKKKITLIASILLILALAVTFVGCNKDKTEETPTTEASEKVSTTEPTTKFEAPEIKDEPTTEETTEATTEPTTKMPVYNQNSGSSSSSGSSNSGSSSSNSGSNSKPVQSQTTTVKNYDGGEVLDDGRVVVVTNANGGGIYIDADAGKGNGGELPADNWKTDPDVQEALEADKNPDAWLQ